MTVILKGDLKSWTNIVTGYSTRFFVLTDETLEYYQSAKVQANGKKIHLSCVSILESDRPRYAKIGTGFKSLNLKFSSDTEKNMWLEHIEMAK